MAFWSKTRYEDEYSSETDETTGATYHENLYQRVTTTYTESSEREETEILRRNEWVTYRGKCYSAEAAHEFDRI